MFLCGFAFAADEGADPDLLVVSETRWGFDNTVQAHAFIPLSIHLQNVADFPWAGKLKLSRGVSNKPVGMPIEFEVTLQANESRWVQVVPFIIDDFEDWTLRWGPGKNHQAVLSNLQKGPRATVLIFNTDAVSPPGGPLRRLPEELFPTSVTATESLRGVIFNTPPFWHGARAQAFIEWLRAGGRVYILHTENGSFPSFNKPLDFLNFEQQSLTLGRGVVKKIPLKLEEVDIDYARKQIFNDDWNVRKQPIAVRPNSYDYQFTSSWNRYSEIFRELRPLTIFQRRWWLIYLCAFAYLGVLVKCYQIGRRNERVSYFYGAFFSSVLLFSGLFIALGQLGASVQNRLRSVSLVQHIHEDTYEVTDWAIAANVNAGEYKLVYNGTGNLFSTCSEMESVSGKFITGLNGEVDLKMPPATLRTLMQKRRVTLTMKQPHIEAIDNSTGGLLDLSISTKGCFENSIIKAFAIHRQVIYPLEEKTSLLRLQEKKQSANLKGELSRMPTPMWQAASPSGIFKIKAISDVEDETSEAVRYEQMLKSLVGNSYNLTNEIDERLMQLSGNTLRLAVFTAMPEHLKCTTADFPDQQGCALFVFDITVAN